MKPPLQATKFTALLSGTVLGIGMPTIETVGQTVGLSPSAQNLAFLAGLVFLFFGPVLIFVAGTDHLSLKSKEVLKSDYWVSLGQVALRSVFWLVGGALGFALLSAMRGLSS